MTRPHPPISITRDKDGKVVVALPGFEPSPEERARRKALSARCGHVKRRLLRGEPLTRDLLEFVMEMGVDESIAAKLQAGEKLDAYELHLMVDVYLVHRRLAGH